MIVNVNVLVRVIVLGSVIALLPRGAIEIEMIIERTGTEIVSTMLTMTRGFGAMTVKSIVF